MSFLGNSVSVSGLIRHLCDSDSAMIEKNKPSLLQHSVAQLDPLLSSVLLLFVHTPDVYAGQMTTMSSPRRKQDGLTPRMN